MSVSELKAVGISVLGGGDVLIRDLDLSVRAGQITGVTGASGSGKTSLLYAVGGLIPAAEGRLLIDGDPIVLWRDTSTGLIFQNLCLVALLSAQETVALPMQARGVPRSEIEQRSVAALEALGLGDHTHQLVDDLSGGQRQRVAVARALAGQPDVILADEPTSALDARWREVVLEMLAGEAKRGAIVVLASSDAEVMAVCDQVVTL